MALPLKVSTFLLHIPRERNRDSTFKLIIDRESEVTSDMDEPPVNVLQKDVQTGSTSESDRQGYPRIKHI